MVVLERIISHRKCREAPHQPKRLLVDGRLMEIPAVVVRIHPEFKLALGAVEPAHLAAVLQLFE